MDRKVVAIGVDPDYYRRFTSAKTADELLDVAREGAPVISHETGEKLAHLPGDVVETGVRIALGLLA